jgi:type I restriction enzyme S subunit
MAAEWVPIRLGDACTKIGSGATPRGGSDVYLPSGPYALIRSQNVYNDAFRHDGLVYIEQQHASELANVEVLEGDVLLNITGDSVARACQVDPRVLPARVNQHVAIIRPDPAKLDPRFLRYFLVSPEMQTKLLSWAGSGGTRNALTKGMIESFAIQAPADIDEQRAIARILGTLDDKIELNRRMSETLEAMARTLFKSWFVHFDPVRAKAEGRSPGLPQPLADSFPARLVDSELGEIPEGWEVGSVYEIADVIYGAPFASAQFNGDGIGDPLIRIRDLAHEAPGVWTREVHPRGYKVQPGDIVVGMDGEFRAHLWGGAEGWLNQRVCVFAPRSGWSAAFVRNAISEPLARVEATEMATTVIHLGKADIDHFRVVLPKREVVAFFNRVCQPWYDGIVTSKQESRTLAALRDTLLPKLISGGLRVEEPRRFLRGGD